MSFVEITCYVATCDGCGTDCWDGCEDGPPHFVGAGVAAAQVLAELHGWEIEKLADGTIRMSCPRCSRRRECDQGGHHWYTPALDAAVSAGVRPVELCGNCGIVRRDYEPLDAPPARHPESMDVVLADEDEALLVRYDNELFPEEAI